MLNLAGNQGTTLANDSVEPSARSSRRTRRRRPGVKAYVTGPAALSDDMHVIGNASLAKITLFTLGAIAIMLLLVYRSIVTTLIQLFMTFVALASRAGCRRGSGYNNAFGLTTFAANILTMLAIAAGTDYGIFLVGRYQEALRAGEDRESAYYTTFRGVAPVVLGSGLTIAGATYCLSFARLPWFNTMGAPGRDRHAGRRGGRADAGSRRCLPGQPVRSLRVQARGQARPALAAGGHGGSALARTDSRGQRRGRPDRHGRPAELQDELQRPLLPADLGPVNLGHAAADRHFSQARMNPDMLMVEADHDMRNPADMLVLDRVAKNVMRTVGIAMVQDITRPLGIPIQHSSIPFQNSMQSQTTMQNMPFLKDRMADMLKMADQMQVMIDTTRTHVRGDARISPTPLTTAQRPRRKRRQSPTNCGTTSRISMTSVRPIADLLLLGQALLRHSRLLVRCGPCSTRWTGSTSWPSSSTSSRVTSQRTASATHELTALLPPMIASLKTTHGLTLTLYQTSRR